ncbi:GspH/FimT family pseudopilin [Kaarinaea lacus]
MKKQSGFTLIELMVVLAIAVFLITSAVPGFQAFIQNNRMSTTAHQFIVSVNLARSEAVKRGKQVSMCKSSDASTCTSNDGWEQGWVVFVDENGDGQRQTTPTEEEILRVQNKLSGIESINGQTQIADVISYAENGFIQPVGGGAFSKSALIVCDSRNFGSHAKALIISATGSIRSTSATESELTSCNA